MTLSRLAVATALILATGLVLLLLWQFRVAVLLFLLSLMIAAALHPLIGALAANGIPRNVALIAVYVVVVIIGGAFLYAVVVSGVDELYRAGNGFVAFYDRIWAEWPEGTRVQQFIIGWLPAPADLYGAVAGDQITGLLTQTLGLTLNVVDFLSQGVAVFMLSLYWSLDRTRFERLWLSLLPAHTRARAREAWSEIETDVGQYVRSEVIRSWLAGVALGGGYWALGLPFPTLLGLWSVLVWPIPWFGVALAFIPAALVGFGVSVQAGLLAMGYALLVTGMLEYFVKPRFTPRRYSALLVVTVMIALADLIGLIGIIFAPPVAAALQTLFDTFTRSASAAPSAELIHDMDTLEERLASVRAAVSEAGPEAAPHSVHLTQRLTQLLQRARHLLHINGQFDQTGGQSSSLP